MNEYTDININCRKRMNIRENMTLNNKFREMY